MVVPSASWIQNVTDSNQNKSMFATGILICHDNSYPFQERTLLLEQPIKIGRSVARARAGTDNAIFDCKVLSRNHALLWYDSGKFYLKDTKSSNGTFVNNKRLSPSGEESNACELNSGDIVQFGVDVVESTKKVTHGCIVATLKLYLPDGKEAKVNLSNSVTYVNVTLEDLYKLNQFIQEAGRRENALRSKLEYMQQLLEHTRIAVSQSWKASVLEDCLLSRLEMLENQVVIYSKNFGEEKLRLELLNLLEDKTQYQLIAKELLKKKIQEKREIIGKVHILKCRLSETEELTQSLHNIIKENQSELQELAIKYINAQQNLHDITEKLNKAEIKFQKFQKQYELEKLDLIKKLESQHNNQSLQLSLNGSNIDSINIYKQISAIKNHLQTLQDSKYTKNSSDVENDSNLTNTLNFILGKWNSMYIKILDSNFFVNKAQKKEIYMFDDIKLKNSFYNLECILYNQLLQCIQVKNSCKYILPCIVNKTFLFKNDFKDQKFLNHISTNSYLSENILNDCKTDLPLINNTIVTEFSKRNIKSEKNKSIEIIMKFSHEELENFSMTPPNKCVSNSTCIESESFFENKFLSSQIIQVAQQINRIINENQDIFSKKNRVKIDQIYSNNNYIINTLKSLMCTKNTLNQCFYEFLFQNTLFLSDLSTKIDYSNSNVVQKLKQWLLSESNDVIFNRLKDYAIKVENDCHQTQELSEQLIIMKEKYISIIEEKANITQKYVDLKAEHKNFFRYSYKVPIFYFAPILLMLLWLLVEKIK